MTRTAHKSLAVFALSLSTAALFASNCKDASHLSGTALLIRVELGSLAPDQLRYLGENDAGSLFGPSLRPEVAGAKVTEFSSVRVLLADSLGGQAVDVTVEGLTEGSVVGTGRARVQIERGVERLVNVVLATSEGCTGCPGCCENNRCLTPSSAACGTAGSSCTRCNDTTADGCRPDGQCGCGNGPTCTSAIGADRCTSGECRCGTGPACGPGTECLFGACQCTAASCAGCCQGGQCLLGNSAESCGQGGRACLDCGATACTGGLCGTATCNDQNCAGCCAGSSCLPGDAGNVCGTGGAACASCGSGTCDQGSCTGACGPLSCAGCCENGVCQPGTVAAACGLGGSVCADCGTGQCTGGACTGGCSPANCPNGCCSGGTCVTGNSNQACGRAGLACVNCGTGSCSAGTCQAACDPANCANGCCDSTGVCRQRSSATCGTNGGACMSCPAGTTDSCPAGSCRCGANPACGPGLQCVGSQCLCTALSCAGCCSANGLTCQTGDKKQACGTGGAICVGCTGGNKCTNHVCQ